MMTNRTMLAAVQRVAAIARPFQRPALAVAAASRKMTLASASTISLSNSSSIAKDSATASTTKISPDIQARLDMDKKTMQSVIAESTAKGENAWEQMWQEGATPWDKGTASPALVKLINEDRIPEGRVLVPGCGGGYDLVALASPTRFAVGVDISPTAVAKVRETLSKHQVPGNQAAVIAADFFTFTESDLPAHATTSADGTATPQFDAIFDYTFKCALPPAWRPRWAARMAELVRPGGTLVTLMYPLGDHLDGPPFAVTPDGYRELLCDAFDEIEVSDCESFPARVGREKLGVWKRKA
ncbi:hypothetical protein AMAG_08543 [Allomyces macrogynus ATCC 38327]|uniref:Thiopurine S-methyltransferase n=1 Tax=Allomyces macrogynus (strain ATCC 38327) TaxID=578462 RepID=A0A0L0SLI5_ALLM3|nr:hypothetical protein AMAG_08543 [Allomyces macrogynus ATCC 38327]|eukprot:KNE63411.1 hypothetical protein AMAG_08543 [Allomyces macrogynus ATCC 38327]